MLAGDKVVLRSVRRDDLPRICAFNDLDVELAGGGDPPMPQSLERLQAEFDREAAKGGRDGATFGIEVDGELIGVRNLHNCNETACTCELSIGIGDKTAWGQGYGRDAVRLLLDYAFRLRNFHRVWLWTHAKNERAIRSYRVRGFVEEGRLRQHIWSNGAYDDVVQMGILRDELSAVSRQPSAIGADQGRPGSERDEGDERHFQP